MTAGNRRAEGRPAAAAESDAQARRCITVAVERARRAAAPRRVMVVFTGDWCGDSAAFLAALEHPLVAPLVALGLEVVTLDAGNRDRHVAIAEGWGISYAQGLPAVAVLDRRRRAGRRHPRRRARLGTAALADRRRDAGAPLAAAVSGPPFETPAARAPQGCR